MQMKSKTKKSLSIAAFLSASCAAIIFFNIIIGIAANKIQMRFDLTANKIYALKDETKAVLKSLKEDVTLYYFASEGREDNMVVNVLNMYRTASDKVHIEQNDPNTDPLSARRFMDKGIAIEQNSIVLECGSRYREISPSEIFSSYNKQSGEEVNYAYFELEQLITRAIAYVASDKTYSVCFTVGHNEPDYSHIVTALQNENIECYQIDLKTGDIPNEVDAVYIMAPAGDFTAEEIIRLDTFLSKGKGAYIAFDATKKALPKLEEYLQTSWGAYMYPDLVCETDSNKTVNYPYMFYPKTYQHAITEKVQAQNASLICMHARSMAISEVQEVKATPILSTAETGISFHGTDSSVKGNLREGTLPVAALFTRQEMDKPENRLLVSGSYKMYEPLFIDEPSVSNSTFLTQATKYLVKSADTISVSPKNLITKRIIISDGQTRFYIFLVCVLPSLVCFVIGAIVWRRRRHL